jgi:arsenite methyltransferase
MNSASQLREGVREAYSAAAERPGDKHAFPIGRAFAESVGYSPDQLAVTPPPAVDAFAGVSNVAEFADLRPGMRVLDLGCGAGLDAQIAARRVGPDGHVTGIDYSEDMLERARSAATESGLGNLEFYLADAERLPVPDASFDVALVNGIFNLNPARDAIFGELGRVVNGLGAVFAAELILVGPLPEGTRCSASNWFA